MKNDATPEIHILMPAYNTASMAEAALARSIRSVLTQDYPAAKLIVYDDGSTDNTLQIIKNHVQGRKADAHIERAGEHKGVAHARARLIEISRELNPNAYFMWLDSDDQFMTPGGITTIMQQMRKTQAEICLFTFDTIWENPEDPALRTNARGVLQGKTITDDHLARIAAFPTVSFETYPDILNVAALGWTKAYAPGMKSLWPATANGILEDYPPMALLLRAKRITALPPEQKIVGYFRRSTSVTGDRKPEHFLIDLPLQLRAFLDTIDLANPAKRRAAFEYVDRKLHRFDAILTDMIEARRPGFTDEVRQAYHRKALAFDVHL